jgi:hypothetical protein
MVTTLCLPGSRRGRHSWDSRNFPRWHPRGQAMRCGLAVTLLLMSSTGCPAQVIFEGSGGAGGAGSETATTSSTFAGGSSAAATSSNGAASGSASSGAASSSSSSGAASSSSSSGVGSGTSSSTASSGVGGAGAGGSGGAGGGPILLPPQVEIDLDVVAFDQSIDFYVPPNTVGFTAIAEYEDPSLSDQYLGIESITAPSGVPLIKAYTMTGTQTYFYNQGIAAAAVPQSDAAQAMPPEPGFWQITIGDALSGSGLTKAHLSVWLRQTIDGAFYGGRLDINIFIAGDAATPQYMIDAIHSAFTNFAGLFTGNITVQGISDSYSYIDQTNVGDALELTAGAEGRPALNVLVVSALGGDYEGAIGLASSIPGNALKHGTHISGVFVTVAQDAVLDKVVLRHEAGHFAGLSHTSEYLPGFGDALSDTPQCADAFGLLSSCPDYSNLMFPTGGDFSLTLTPHQVNVVQASALYRGMFGPGIPPAPPLPSAVFPLAQPSKNGEPAAALSSTGVLAKNSWTTGLAPRLVTLLGGLWCTGASKGSGPDYIQTLRDAGATDAARLFALGIDPSAPLHVRRRALMAAGHAHPSSEVLAKLTRLAEDQNVPRGLRFSAIEGISAASRPLATRLAERLQGRGDLSTARVAAHIAARSRP